jgi:hypothetical protein
VRNTRPVDFPPLLPTLTRSNVLTALGLTVFTVAVCSVVYLITVLLGGGHYTDHSPTPGPRISRYEWNCRILPSDPPGTCFTTD